MRSHISFKQRLQKVRGKLKNLKLNGFLITTPANLRYFSGFGEESCLALVSNKEAVFFAPALYFPEVKDIVKYFKVVILNQDYLQKYIHKLKIKSLGFEEDNLTYTSFKNWQKRLGKIKFIPAKRLIEDLRLIKDKQEITTIQKAVSITDKIYQKILKLIKPGLSELELANKIEFLIKAAGCDIAFKTVVASGKYSACPHHLNRARKFEKGDVLILDFGAVYQGYHSDLTRTVFLGKLNRQDRKLYMLVLSAQNEAIRAIRPGIPARRIDDICRQEIASRGYGKYFVHNTGHGVGLEIHEAPFLSQKSDTVLKEGMIMTVEPGIYIPGWGGIRIEDMVLVTKDGYKILTKASSKMTVVKCDA